MWSLGKVIKTPEVLRVYLGSFWDKPYAAPGKENEKLFEAETQVSIPVYLHQHAGFVGRPVISTPKLGC